MNRKKRNNRRQRNSRAHNRGPSVSQQNRVPPESIVINSKFPDIPDEDSVESMVGNVSRVL